MRRALGPLALFFVSIPFPGFVSNQVINNICVKSGIVEFQSRFQDSFQIKLQVRRFLQVLHSCFNPVSRIRFKSSYLNPATSGAITAFQSRFQDSFQIKLMLSQFGWSAYKFQSRFQDSFQIKVEDIQDESVAVNCFNPVSRIRFKSSMGYFKRKYASVAVSIPFPGFVSNQAHIVGFAGQIERRFQSRFQDSFQIKVARSTWQAIKKAFQSRFQDSFQIKYKVRIESQVSFQVSIPFPGFVSNQG